MAAQPIGQCPVGHNSQIAMPDFKKSGNPAKFGSPDARQAANRFRSSNNDAIMAQI